MTSNCAGAVQSAFRLNVGGMGFFGCGERTKMPQFPIQDDLGKPSITSSLVMRAKQLAFGSSLRGSLVLHVFRAVNASKVAKPVITFEAINMIQLFGGKAPCHVKPCESMGKIPTPKNADLDIPVGVFVSNFATNRPSSVDACFSEKYAGSLVVLKKRLKHLLGKDRMLFSHAVSPLKKWFGQMPGGIPLPSGHRHFTTGVA